MARMLTGHDHTAPYVTVSVVLYLLQVLRVFGHINGFGGGDEERSDFPFQPSLGVFNETNLRRYDLVLDELSQAKSLDI